MTTQEQKVVEIQKRIQIEREIVEAIVSDAIQAGYSINVDNGGEIYEFPVESNDFDKIVKALFQTDEEYLLFWKGGERRVGWVRLVYGNDGWDVVNDYSTNLDGIVMQRANNLANKYAELV